MKAVVNTISRYPPFFIERQLAFTHERPPRNPGIIKNEPSNSNGWINILKRIIAQVQKKPQTIPAKLPLNICCKNPPHMVEMRDTNHAQVNIVPKITGNNVVMRPFIPQDIVSPISGFIKLAKNKNIRKIINTFQMTLIKKNKKICVEGRDIASKILAKNPKYDLAFYFKCNIKVASYRRWLDIKKKVSLQNVRKSLTKRTLMDKKRKNSPLVKVKDAILIQTDKLTKKQVLSKMSEHIESLN